MVLTFCFELLSLVRSFYPETGQSQELFFYPAQTFLPIATVVEEVGGALRMGGIRGADRIVIFEEAIADKALPRGLPWLHVRVRWSVGRFARFSCRGR